MTTTSIKLMLLGIGLILFGLVFPTTIGQLFAMQVIALRAVVFSRYTLEMIVAVVDSLFVLAGLILLLVGFFRREAISGA